MSPVFGDGKYSLSAAESQFFLFSRLKRLRAVEERVLKDLKDPTGIYPSRWDVQKMVWTVKDLSVKWLTLLSIQTRSLSRDQREYLEIY